MPDTIGRKPANATIRTACRERIVCPSWSKQAFDRTRNSIAWLCQENFALQRRIMELEQRTMLLRRQIDIYDQILLIQNQIKIQSKNLSKLIQQTKNEQIKTKLKQQYKLLTMPDQQIA